MSERRTRATRLVRYTIPDEARAPDNAYSLFTCSVLLTSYLLVQAADGVAIVRAITEECANHGAGATLCLALALTPTPTRTLTLTLALTLTLTLTPTPTLPLPVPRPLTLP